MKILGLISLICFLLVGLSSFVGCTSGISDEQRDEYMRNAEIYDNVAADTQRLADSYWYEYQRVTTDWTSDHYRAMKADYLEKSKHYAELAKQYRQYANDYRALARQ